MANRFPGMDPYLEDPAFWPGFHSRFINACSELLYDHLPEDYDADIEERVQVVDLSRLSAQPYVPDVKVTRESGQFEPAMAGSAGGRSVSTLEPVVVPMKDYMEVREVYIEVYERPERELVTIIELLSPSNKVGEGMADYLAKRRILLNRGINLVEIDLLVGGRRLPSERALPGREYMTFVSRSHRRPDSEVYAWGLREPLPKIPVPLRPPDGDVPLDLAAVFGTAYERGRYARKLHYDRPPSAHLSPHDAEWAQLVAAT